MSDDLFVVEDLSGNRSLCISTLAEQTVADAEASHMGGDQGLFIYEVDDNEPNRGIQVLAKVASLEAAFRLIDLWRA